MTMPTPEPDALTAALNSYDLAVEAIGLGQCDGLDADERAEIGAGHAVIRAALARHARLVDVVTLPLLFHGAGTWDEAKRLRWRQITGVTRRRPR